jgi:hypothetical protein
MVLNYCKESRVGGVEYEEKGAAMVMTQSGDTEAKEQQGGGKRSVCHYQSHLPLWQPFHMTMILENLIFISIILFT